MSREVRRVPLDFNWPLDQVWHGYLMPDTLALPQCPDCQYGQDHSSGYSPQAWAISHTFYPHQIAWAGQYPGARDHTERLAWHDKLGQAEVDMLIAEGRLRKLVPRQPTPDNPRDREWVSIPRTAAEVNEVNRTGRSDGDLRPHDGINHYLLVRFRCSQLGIPVNCPTCNGESNVGTPEQRAAADAWEPTGPPSGDGWQLWETVSEGSPMSPVFATADELASWMSDPARGRDWVPGDVAARFIGVGWAPSAAATRHGFKTGVEYVGTPGAH